MSLRIIPSASHPSSTSKQATSAPSAPGLPDTLRSKLSSTPTVPSETAGDPADSSAVPASAHPLEARLLRWRQTQHALKMEGLRRTFGIAEPVRRGMELNLARQGEYRPGVLGGSAGVSGDILEGRDWECSWDDVFQGGDETAGTSDFHLEMENKLKMTA